MKNKFIVLLIILVVVLVLPQVHSQVIEKYYNSNTKTISLQDRYEDVAEVKLLTPLKFYVNTGYNKVAEFEINNMKEASNFIDGIESYDIKNGMKVKPVSYDYKYYAKVGTKEVDDLEYQCNEQYENKTPICEYVVVGKHTEDVYNYLPFDNNKVLDIGKVRIALFTNVKEGDLVEWIPTFKDVRITEWALYGSAITDVNPSSFGTTGSDSLTRGQCFVAKKDLEVVSVGFNASTPTKCYLYQGCNINTYLSGGNVVDKTCIMNTTNSITKGTNFSVAFNNGASSYGFAYNPSPTHISGTNVNITVSGYAVTGAPPITYYVIQFDMWNITTKSTTNMTVSLITPTNNSYTFINTNATFNCSIESENLLRNVSLWTNVSGIVATDTSCHGVPSGDNMCAKNLSSLFSYNVTENIKWNCIACDINNQTCYWGDSNYTLNTANNFTIDDVYYLPSTIEGSNNFFSLNLSIAPSLSLQNASFIYNNTRYSTSISLISTGKYQLYSNFQTPLVNNTTNYTFYWDFQLSSGSFNSTSYNQTVYNLVIDDCSATSDVIYNFTLKDEETQQLILYPNTNYTSIEVYFKLMTLSLESIVEYNKTFNETNPVAICINATQMSNSQFYSQLQVKYSSGGYAPEYYNTQRYLINKSRLWNNITLYDLNSSSNTDFIIIVKDSDYIIVPDAIVQISRRYVGEGTYKIVEIPLTDIQGQAIGHFNTNGVVYSISVYKNGALIGIFDSISVKCQDVLTNTCILNLNALSTIEDFLNFDTLDNLYYNMYFNKTSRKTFVNFVTTDGTNANILINSSKIDNFGNTTLCTSSIFSSSGLLSCEVPASYGNLTIQSCLYKDNQLMTCEIYTITPNATDNFGTDGFFMVFLLLLILPLMFLTSLIGMLIGGILGILIAGLLVMYNGGTIIGTSSAIIWILIASGILIWKITKRRAGGLG